MTTFYRLDGQALTYGEYWRFAKDVPTFLVAAVRKLLRFPIPFKFSIARVDKLSFVEPDLIPEDVRHAWRGKLKVCQEQGLQVQFYYSIPVLEKNREGYAATHMNEDGTVLANLCYARSGAMDTTAFSCLSLMEDGRYFITSDQPRKLVTPPRDEIVRYPGAPASKILARHREMLDLPDHVPARVSPARLPQLVLEREQSHVDFHAERGVYVPMSPEEIEELCARLEVQVEEE